MSSSFDFKGIRILSNDPMNQFLVEMQKRLAKALTDAQAETVDSDNEDIYSDAQDMETAIKWHTELSGQHFFEFDKDYYSPFEPDGDQVKLWLRGINTGSTLKDFSGFNNTADVYGDPILVDGSLDLGTQTHGVLSTALRFNTPTSHFENQEWLQVADTSGLQLASASTGFSVFVRVRLLSLAQQGGRDPTIFEKIDDSTPNNACMLQAKSDGRLVFIVKKAGTTTAKETTAGMVTTNVVHDIFLSFSVTGSVMKIYIDGTNKALTNFTGNVNWHEDLDNHDLFIGRRGLGNEEGFVYFDFYDFKPYYNRIVTQAEVTNHYNNKWTISSIPFGQIIISNHWATKLLAIAPSPSFTSTSFTSQSFTIFIAVPSFSVTSFMPASFTE